MRGLKYNFAKLVCKVLPPIISQTVRHLIIPNSDGLILNKKFVAKSFTGSLFTGNTADFHAFRISIHGYFDWRNVVIANVVLKNIPGNIIEVGANIGTETISFSDIAQKVGRQVVAFEPLTSNFEVLTENIKLNRTTNVQVHKCLVSDHIGTANFKIPEANFSGSGHITTNDAEEDVEEISVVTLDNILQDMPVSIIAIDVEGFEYQVMTGAKNSIMTNRPVIIVEVNKNYLRKRAGLSLETFYKFFTDNNYNCFYINKLGIDKVDISDFTVKSNKNWVCIPSEHHNLHSKISTSLAINGLNPLFSYFHF